MSMDSYCPPRMERCHPLLQRPNAQAVSELGRLRARSIAGLFSQPPSEPDGILVASSGSPVSLSLWPWPIGMHSIMACSAEWDTLAFACDHDLHPERFLPPALLVQVCEFAYMVHVYPLFASAYLACVVS